MDALFTCSHQVGCVPMVSALYHSGIRGRSAAAKARLLTSPALYMLPELSDVHGNSG